MDGKSNGTPRWGQIVCAATLSAVVALAPALTSGARTAGAAHATATPAHTAAAHKSASSSGFSDTGWGDPLADALALVKGGNSASADPGSLYTIESAIGARSVWAQTDSSGRQLTGQGVAVALLDSGTASVAGLNSPGKLTYGPDLSVESNGVLTDQDTFGHGTFMAGIIGAHDGGALTAANIARLSPSQQLGIAPDAKLVSLKLANSDGSSDVTEIIAALDWVTQHPIAADGSKIRVINLSFGTDSVQPYQLDPLAAAAENAWRHGIVVVVSGGNEGQSAGRLTDPAMDPYVLAVGASDSKENLLGWSTPVVASYSSSGTASRHVDVIAPGTSVVSLRDPGSSIDQNHPEGLVAGDSSGRLFRGSGTSQAAAVVSGAVALVLQANPNLTPDQVKSILMSTARPVAASPIYAGSGQLNVSAAVASAKLTAFTSAIGLSTSRPQTYPISTGQGSLDAARGGAGLVDADGQPLTGEVDAQGNPWQPAVWWWASSTLSAWSGGSWLGSVWTGDGWVTDPSGLSSARWSSAQWSDGSGG